MMPQALDGLRLIFGWHRCPSSCRQKEGYAVYRQLELCVQSLTSFGVYFREMAAAYEDGFSLLELSRNRYLEVGLDIGQLDAMVR